MDFSILIKKINILVIDADAQYRNGYKNYLSRYAPYTVTTTRSQKAAERLIRKKNYCHACIMEIGLDDMRGDEFYLLRRYAHQIPFVIVSSSTSIAKGFMANKLGAFNVIAKPVDFTSLEFLHAINKAAAKGILIKKCLLKNNSIRIINKVLDVLVNHGSIKLSEIRKKITRR